MAISKIDWSHMPNNEFFERKLPTLEGIVDLHNAVVFDRINYELGNGIFILEGHEYKSNFLKIGDKVVSKIRLKFSEVYFLSIKPFDAEIPMWTHAGLEDLIYSKDDKGKRFTLDFNGGMVIEIGFQDMMVEY